MEKVTQPDFCGAEVRVKGYRFGFVKLLGILLIFFSSLSIFIAVHEMKITDKSFLIGAWCVFGVIVAFAVGLIVYETVADIRLKKRDCVVLYKDGMTVFVDKPKQFKGYCYFRYDELTDYGFIHIVRKTGESGESRPIFSRKEQSVGTYLWGDLLNYGYMRITDKDGGYYNVPVGDIDTVRTFLKQHTAAEEFIYQRIAGIHDDVIIPLK